MFGNYKSKEEFFTALNAFDDESQEENTKRVLDAKMRNQMRRKVHETNEVLGLRSERNSSGLRTERMTSSPLKIALPSSNGRHARARGNSTDRPPLRETHVVQPRSPEKRKQIHRQDSMQDLGQSVITATSTMKRRNISPHCGAAPSMKKVRKAKGPVLQPEHRQIFKGLTFCELIKCSVSGRQLILYESIFQILHTKGHHDLGASIKP
jgi:hypothetical protein